MATRTPSPSDDCTDAPCPNDGRAKFHICQYKDRSDGHFLQSRDMLPFRPKTLRSYGEKIVTLLDDISYSVVYDFGSLPTRRIWSRLEVTGGPKRQAEVEPKSQSKAPASGLVELEGSSRRREETKTAEQDNVQSARRSKKAPLPLHCYVHTEEYPGNSQDHCFSCTEVYRGFSRALARFT